MTVDHPSATRGGTFTVRVDGDRTGYRDSRVELLLVERKFERKYETKLNYAIVISTTSLGAADQCVVEVPKHLPNTYRGEAIGWDYELRLVGDRAGPDHEQVVPVWILGDAPTDRSAPDLRDLRSSASAVRAHIFGYHRGSVREAFIACAVLGLASTVIGLLNGWLFLWIGGVVLLLMAVPIAISLVRHRRLHLDSVPFEVPEDPVRLGGTVTVRVQAPVERPLEVCLLAVATFLTGGGNGRRHGLSRRVYEHTRPALGSTVELQVPADQPAGYAGDEIAVHWMVILRDPAVPERQQGLASRVVPISVMH